MAEEQCGSCSGKECGKNKEDEKLQASLGKIKNKLVILSGKGGVGKSTVAVNIAAALSLAGKKVGLLDVDVHGPSIPRMLSLTGEQPHIEKDYIEPIQWSKNLWVMSLGFMLPNRNDAVIWRGPIKMGLIKQFLQDVAWGELDYLVVDCPPGTGDEPLSTLQLIGPSAQAVIVSTPQGVAVDDVRRSVTFCSQVGNPVLGLVENMSGYACPKCGEVSDIFASGGGEDLAREMGIKFLGRIPIDPEVVRSGDQGYVYVKTHHESEAAQSIGRIIKPMLAMGGDLQEKSNPGGDQTEEKPAPSEGKIKVAVPVANGKLCMHFGHCQKFAMVEADAGKKEILGMELMDPPPHEPGVLPEWVANQGAALVIAGGMGSRAQSLFNQHGVKVLVGAPAEGPEDLVKSYLEGTLSTGENVCDH
ncbi:MAG: iron-sulfur cluster carrier protein MrpORP [Desulfonatronovibrionaceae bacterium]